MEPYRSHLQTIHVKGELAQLKTEARMPANSCLPEIALAQLPSCAFAYFIHYIYVPKPSQGRWVTDRTRDSFLPSLASSSCRVRGDSRSLELFYCHSPHICNHSATLISHTPHL